MMRQLVPERAADLVSELLPAPTRRFDGTFVEEDVIRRVFALGLLRHGQTLKATQDDLLVLLARSSPKPWREKGAMAQKAQETGVWGFGSEMGSSRASEESKIA